MQCGRCAFHNLPGLTVCMKCGSVLTAAAPIDVNPPRAGWTKVFRPVEYHINRWFRFALPTRLRQILGHVLPKEFLESFSPVHMVLSIIPGLGHLVLGQFSKVYLILAGWLATILAGLFLYGSFTGNLLLGFGIALHAWIIADSGKMWELFKGLLPRLFFSVAMSYLLVMGVYLPIQGMAGEYVRGIVPGASLPTDGIQATDYLLINPRAYHDTAPERGDVVLVSLSEAQIQMAHANRRLVHRDVIAKVVGIGGDRIKFEKGWVQCIVGERIHSTYPVSGMGLQEVEATVEVPEGMTYCLYQFEIHGGNPGQRQAVLTQFSTDRCLFDRESIHGRAFMIYSPLARRKFINREDPAGKSTPVQ